MDGLDLSELEGRLEGDLRRVRRLRADVARVEGAMAAMRGPFWLDMRVCEPPVDDAGMFERDYRFEMRDLSDAEMDVVRELLSIRTERNEAEIRALTETYGSTFGLETTDSVGDSGDS